MKELSIGQVAAQVGLAASAIRYYEAEGLLPAAARRSGRRIYGPEIVERLRFVELAKAAGFTVAETRRLLRGFSRKTPAGVRWRALAEKKHAELEARIAEARRMKEVLELLMRCECPSFDDCARAMD